MGFNEEFCARVKKAREELTTLTQDQMADKIGVGRSAYRHYEGGRNTRMPHRYIPKFLKETKASRQWLLEGTGPMKEEDNDFLSIMKKIEDPAMQAKLKDEALKLLLSEEWFYIRGYDVVCESYRPFVLFP